MCPQSFKDSCDDMARKNRRYFEQNYSVYNRVPSSCTVNGVAKLRKQHEKPKEAKKRKI